MKKLLSVILALSMVFALACTAMAARSVSGAGETGSEEGVDKLWGPFVLSSKEINDNTTTFSYGDTVYYLLLDASGDPIVDYDAVKNVSVKVEWDEGKDYIQGAEITRVSVGDSSSTDFFGGSRASCYLLAIATDDEVRKSEADVSGTVRLRCTKDGFEVDADYAIDFCLGYVEPDDYTVICKDPFLYDGDTLKATDDDDYEFTFEAVEDMTLTVDVTKQKDIMLWLTTDENETVAKKYRTADLDFYTGCGASFVATAEIFIPAETGSYLYMISGDEILDIPTATFDEYDGGWTFKSKTLGSYVVSDRALLAGSTAASPSSSASASASASVSASAAASGSPIYTANPQNPNTGAQG